MQEESVKLKYGLSSFMTQWQYEHETSILYHIEEMCPRDNDYEKCVDKVWSEVIEKAKDDVKDALNYYNTKPDPFPVWRAITVEHLDNFLERLNTAQFQVCDKETRQCFDGIGTSWTDDEEFAIGYDARGDGVDMILEGEVKKHSVDWDKTLMIGVDIGDYTEEEIRVKDGAEVFITTIKIPINKNIKA